MFDYALKDRDDFRTEYGYDRDYEEVVKKDKGFNRLWLLLIPLFVFVGWAARDYAARANGNALTYSTQYGIGGGPDVPCVSP